MLDYGGQYSQLIARRRARVRRVQRAAAARRPAGGGRRAQAARDHPLGRPGVGIRRRRAATGPRAARAGRAGDGHLLRHAAARPRARRTRRAGRGRRVRPLGPARLEPGVLLRGMPARADLLDVPPRHRLRAAARVHRAGLLELLAGRRRRGHGARHLRHPVSPRGRPHPLRPGDPHALSRPRSAAASGPGRRRRSSRTRSGGSARRWARANVDLRALRRRRLLGGGAARAPRDRRPARRACSSITA